MRKLNISNVSELKLGYVINLYDSGVGVIDSLDNEYIHLKGVFHDHSSGNINMINASKTDIKHMTKQAFITIIGYGGLVVYTSMTDYILDSRAIRERLGFTDIECLNAIQEIKYNELLSIEKETLNLLNKSDNPV